MKKTLLHELLENAVEDRYNKLLNDKEYIDNLIDDILDAEDKADIPKNRRAALKFIKDKYLRDIAKEQLEFEKLHESVTPEHHDEAMEGAVDVLVHYVMDDYDKGIPFTTALKNALHLHQAEIKDRLIKRLKGIAEKRKD